MRVMTFATDWNAGMERFFASCRRVGIALDIHGLGESYPGHAYRLKRLYPFVASLPPGELLLFLDGYDGLLAQGAAEIEARFRAMGCDLLFGAETCCAPHAHLAEQYPPSATQYRFLNAGGYIGYAGAIRRLWDELDVWRLPDALNDQSAITSFFLRHPGRITLDYDQHILQNLFGAEADMDCSAPLPVNTVTGQSACAFHASGGSDLTRVAAALGL